MRASSPDQSFSQQSFSQRRRSIAGVKKLPPSSLKKQATALSFGGKTRSQNHAAASRKEFNEHCARVRLQVASFERERSWIINPDKRLWLKYWDWTRSLGVLFLALVSPVDITMRRTFELNSFVIIGFVCNLMFAIDMFLTFNRAYHAPRHLGGRLIFSRKLITRRYFRGWFFVDIVSTLPYDVAFIYLQRSGVDVLSDYGNSVREGSRSRSHASVVPSFHSCTPPFSLRVFLFLVATRCAYICACARYVCVCCVRVLCACAAGRSASPRRSSSSAA